MLEKVERRGNMRITKNEGQCQQQSQSKHKYDQLQCFVSFRGCGRLGLIQKIEQNGLGVNCSCFPPSLLVYLNPNIY